MCNIAGYNGNKQAAPILIEMIKHQETLDGGLSTGIATIHNGKIYSARVLGNAKDLTENTDALNFPGTVGIIHSRPDDNFLEFAHPFVSQSQKLASVLNGNACSDEFIYAIKTSVAQFLEQHGVEFKSATKLDKSSFPKLCDGRYAAYGEVFVNAVEFLLKTRDISTEKAMADTASRLFSDVVNVLINADSPKNIYVTSISRPMNLMVLPDECFISTSQFGFLNTPPNADITALPHLKSCVIGKGNYKVTDNAVTGGKVTPYSAEEHSKIKEEIINKLKTEPVSMDSMGGGIFVTDRHAENLRPNAELIYNILWELNTQGVLKTNIKTTTIPWLPNKKVKRTFFYI